MKKLTIVIPNRNRALTTVKRSLDSMAVQLGNAATAVVVDYGSEITYQENLEKLIDGYENISLIVCPTQGQLWNKSRCINIVLKECTTTHFMVCDMDMLWHPGFIDKHINELPVEHTEYFTVGFLAQSESALEKPYADYNIKFKSNHEATGISIFPSSQLLAINGFDEFYHGWGSEDTDVHMRLKNAGYVVRFRESEVYFKHQWHEKKYRSRSGTLPFHPGLEHINYQYFLMNKSLGKVKANTSKPWGEGFDLKACTRLEHPDKELRITATHAQVHALTQVLTDLRNDQVLRVEIRKDIAAKSMNTFIKKLLRKKTPLFLSLQQTNNHLLEQLILVHRNNPYSYKYDKQQGCIELILYRNSLSS
ncbi:MAG: galactosyltransferase-related protein [Nonlabens sp.]|nr:galactosyltransferase-related protein [Nonlabens sp.]